MSQDLHDTAVSIAKEADGRRQELADHATGTVHVVDAGMSID